MVIRGRVKFGAFAALALTTATAWGRPTPQGPIAEDGYTLSVFAAGPAGQTKPDSIAVFEGHIFIGYGDSNAADGSDGKNSKVFEYDRDGNVIYNFSVKGHNDGMKVDPYTEKLWVLQNENGNPSLVVFDPETRAKQVYGFANVPANGSGYDDIAFRNGRAYLSASHPQSAINSAPAIVEAWIEHGAVEVRPVLAGNATATNIVSGETAALNLQDPDSMTKVPGGDLLLDSQADSQLVLVRKPGSKDQSAVLIPLSSLNGKPLADDTLFTPSADGFILIVDTGANAIYKLTKAAFAPDVAYTAASVAGTSTRAGFVGRLDLDTGVITPVVTGLNSPNGLAFVKNVDDGRCDIAKHDDDHNRWGWLKRCDDDRRDDDHKWFDDDDDDKRGNWHFDWK